jgi:betaine-aldehyde dehydrogenase
MPTVSTNDRTGAADSGGANAAFPVDGRMLIGGELVGSIDGGWLESHNPANGAYIGRVPRGTAADVDRAVAAGEKAQPGWAALSVSARATALLALTEALMARSEEILVVEVADTGNTITPMRSDLANGIERMKYFIGLGYEQKGESIPSTPNNFHFTVREPYGVVGRLVAFNHPIYFALCGIAAPLMAGNAVILKPSEQSPLSTALLAQIACDVLPPGVLNIVSGVGAEAGEALVRHPRVKRISFVGSAPTGMAIQRMAATHAVKHVTLELGGKNPFIVFPDAPVSKVAAAAVDGMNFGWQGQSCGSTSRLLVHDSIHDAVLQEVVARVGAIRVGDPFDPNSQMGPINNAGQFNKVQYYIDAGVEDGARLAVGGRRPQGAQFEKGYWIEPTVFADVLPDMRIAREEIFGPVLSVLRWSEVDEVIDIANSVELGLTAAVWSNDITQAMRTAKRLQSGYVWVNGVGAHVRAMPYGGYKNSGVGRERGVDEILSYSEEKSIHIML